MPADVNVTEKVREAAWAAFIAPGQYVSSREADAWSHGFASALSTLADPEVLAGIAGVHVVHRTDYDEERREAGCECGWLVMVHPDYAAQVMADHTAAAVVEWLRGRA